MENKELNYKEAVTELENILRKMESDSCDIDSLSAYTRRALELLRFCKERLLKTDKDVEACLTQLRAALEEQE